MDEEADGLKGVWMININGVVEKKLRLLEKKLDEIRKSTMKGCSVVAGNSR